MEQKESPQISINEEVDLNNLYIGKRGIVADGPMELTEEHVYPVEKERPSTGKLSQIPGQVRRKGVSVKE